MKQIYNIYCDESCHLENDKSKIMVIGGVWCPLDNVQAIAKHIRLIKKANGLKKDFEIKWSKVSPAKLFFYKEIVNYFFDCHDLHFRVVIIPDKTKLRHDFFNQTHDDFYYKVFFFMLKTIFQPNSKYRIYLDRKDTISENKVQKLHNVLCNNMYDFSKDIIERVQQVRSHEVAIMQIADLFNGIVSYANRRLSSSKAKLSLVRLAREKSGYDLTKTTLYRENKFNILCWCPPEIENV